MTEDKTEFLVAGTSQQHAKMLFDSLSVSRTIIPASLCVKNLGVIIDGKLILNNHLHLQVQLSLSEEYQYSPAIFGNIIS